MNKLNSNPQVTETMDQAIARLHKEGSHAAFIQEYLRMHHPAELQEYVSSFKGKNSLDKRTSA